MERLEFNFDGSDDLAFFIQEDWENTDVEVEIGVARVDGVMEKLVLTGSEPHLIYKWLGEKLYPVRENE
jgi:hypothetical protein